jgi:thiamine-monophosphate kinase
MANEDQIIERIAKRFAWRGGRTGANLILGIGDDAAILRPRPGSDWVVSSDFSLEGVHFLPSYPPEAVGYRSLARAVSDLAAMGAHPEFFLLSVSLTDSLTEQRIGRWFDQMLSGMARASRQYRLRLIGGDTSEWPQTAIAITVIGRTARSRAIRRDGARVGDRIFVSGELGGAALGLAVMLGQRGGRLQRREPYRQMVQQHLYPKIPIELGIHLAERKLASAMIDLSDGLSSDLTRLARASGVGARVLADRLPAVRVPATLARRAMGSMDLALNGGEDYGLLFTVSAGSVAGIPGRYRGVPITQIGEIVSGSGVELVMSDGRTTKLRMGGWNPFRRR